MGQLGWSTANERKAPPGLNIRHTTCPFPRTISSKSSWTHRLGMNAISHGDWKARQHAKHACFPLPNRRVTGAQLAKRRLVSFAICVPPNSIKRVHLRNVFGRYAKVSRKKRPLLDAWTIIITMKNKRCIFKVIQYFDLKNKLWKKNLGRKKLAIIIQFIYKTISQPFNSFTT